MQPDLFATPIVPGLALASGLVDLGEERARVGLIDASGAQRVVFGQALLEQRHGVPNALLPALQVGALLARHLRRRVGGRRRAGALLRPPAAADCVGGCLSRVCRRSSGGAEGVAAGGRRDPLDVRVLVRMLAKRGFMKPLHCTPGSLARPSPTGRQADDVRLVGGRRPGFRDLMADGCKSGRAPVRAAEGHGGKHADAGGRH